MTRPARVALLAALLASAAPAFADDSVTVSGDDPGPIGIDSCSTQIETDFTLRGAVTFDTNDDERVPTYRLYYFTGEAACYRENGVAECPSHIQDSAGQPCGCVYETTTLAGNEYATTSNIADIMSSDAAVLCGEGAPDELKFVGEIYYPAAGDLSAQSLPSDNLVAITIDRDRPDAPSDMPRVQGVENGLFVSGNGIVEPDVTYEVCVRRVGEQSDVPEGAAQIDVLREGFTQCREVSSGAPALYRFTGLEDGVNYEVVYAAFDVAGNRGPNSPSTTGVPEAQLDFAEQYTASLGGQTGETGGCNAADERAPAGLAWLALGLLPVIRRRRS